MVLRQLEKEWGLIQAIGHQPCGRLSSPRSFFCKYSYPHLSTSYESPPLETPSGNVDIWITLRVTHIPTL